MQTYRVVQCWTGFLLTTVAGIALAQTSAPAVAETAKVVSIIKPTPLTEKQRGEHLTDEAARLRIALNHTALKAQLDDLKRQHDEIYARMMARVERWRLEHKVDATYELHPETLEWIPRPPVAADGKPQPPPPVKKP